MNMLKISTCAIIAGLLTACGGGGGGTGGSSAGGGGGGAGALPRMDPPPPGPTVDYTELGAQTGTSPLAGAILVAGTSVTGTTGTITHSAQTFTASGISGSTSLGDDSAFDLPAFAFATDVGIDASTVAIVGSSTAAADVRNTGTAAYTGQFSGQLVDTSLGPTAATLNWDADIQVNFAGDGDVDITFEGGGSDLIDSIRILNADISGNTFAGGTIRTSNDGVQNNITGTSVDLDGAFFGYNDALLLPAEAGGAIVSQDGDTDISGVFLTTAKP